MADVSHVQQPSPYIPECIMYVPVRPTPYDFFLLADSLLSSSTPQRGRRQWSRSLFSPRCCSALCGPVQFSSDFVPFFSPLLFYAVFVLHLPNPCPLNAAPILILAVQTTVSPAREDGVSPQL